MQVLRILYILYFRGSSSTLNCHSMLCMLDCNALMEVNALCEAPYPKQGAVSFLLISRISDDLPEKN